MHFQITDKPLPVFGTTKPSPINTQGLPWILNHFIREEYIATGMNPVDPDVPFSVQPIGEFKVKNEALMNNNLVNFNHEK